MFATPSLAQLLLALSFVGLCECVRIVVTTQPVSHRRQSAQWADPGDSMAKIRWRFKLHTLARGVGVAVVLCLLAYLTQNSYNERILVFLASAAASMNLTAAFLASSSRTSAKLQAQLDIENQQRKVLDRFFDCAPVLMGAVEFEMGFPDEKHVVYRHILDNKTTLKWLESTKAEIAKVRQGNDNGINKANIQMWRRIFKQAHEKQESVSSEYEHVSPDMDEAGSRFLAAQAYPIDDSEQGNKRFAFLVTDNTERVRMERQLAMQEQRLEYAMTAIKDGVWDINVHTGETYYSKRWAAILGYTPGEVEYSINFWRKLVHPDDITRFETMMKIPILFSSKQRVADIWSTGATPISNRSGSSTTSSSRPATPSCDISNVETSHDVSTESIAATVQATVQGNGKEIPKTEFRMRHKNGSYIICLVRSRLVDGSRIVGAMSDITSLRAADVKIQRAKKDLEDLMQFAPVGLFQLNNQGLITFANKQFCSITGYSASQLANSQLKNHFPRDERDKSIAEFYNQLKELGSSSGTPPMIQRIITANGAERWIHARATRLTQESDSEIFGAVQDVHEQKLIEIELAEKNKQLDVALKKSEIAAESKTIFLSTMSHEIRTPLNGVCGLTGLLLDTKPLNSDQTELIYMIRDCSDHLLMIVNDILDYSKIEAGKLEVENQVFNLRHCIESSLFLLDYKASQKGLNLNYKIDPQVSKLWIGDLTRLRQILVNLIGNAVKFTEKGSVTVEVSCMAEDFEKPYKVLKDLPKRGSFTSNTDVEIIAGVTPFSPVAVRSLASQRYHRKGSYSLSNNSPLPRSPLASGAVTPVEEVDGFNLTCILPDVSNSVPDMSGATILRKQLLSQPHSRPSTPQNRALFGSHPLSKTSLTNSVDSFRPNIFNDHSDTQSEGSSYALLSFTVRDTGIGIPPERLDRLFKSFSQIDASTSRKYGGSGLGLVICRSLVTLLGGEIGVKSVLGKGSDFHFTVRFLSYEGEEEPVELHSGNSTNDVSLVAAGNTEPTETIEEDQSENEEVRRVIENRFSRATRASSTTSTPTPMPLDIDANMAAQFPLKILVAEDNAVNQKLILRLLAKLGYRADISANGLEVIEAIKQAALVNLKLSNAAEVAEAGAWEAACATAYDVILMDVQMPELSGTEATRYIRKTFCGWKTFFESRTSSPASDKDGISPSTSSKSSISVAANPALSPPFKETDATEHGHLSLMTSPNDRLPSVAHIAPNRQVKICAL